MTACASTAARDHAALVRFARELLDATPAPLADTEHGRAVAILRDRLLDAANRGDIDGFRVLRAGLERLAKLSTFGKKERGRFRSYLVNAGVPFVDVGAAMRVVRGGGAG